MVSPSRPPHLERSTFSRRLTGGLGVVKRAAAGALMGAAVLLSSCDVGQAPGPATPSAPTYLAQVEENLKKYGHVSPALLGQHVQQVREATAKGVLGDLKPDEA